MDPVFTRELTLMLVIIAATCIRIVAFVIGYKVVVLGHDTMVRGIRGEFQLEAESSGQHLRLQSGIPGLLFVLLGSGIVLYAVFVRQPIGLDYSDSRAISAPATVSGHQRPANQSVRNAPNFSVNPRAGDN